MNITNTITDGMTAQEREIYFAHMEKRHREEAEKIDYERQQTRAYKDKLIADALKVASDRFTEEELRKMSIRRLENIW